MANSRKFSNGNDYSSIEGSSTPEKRWQNEMLIALQNTATPEPIRLACMKSQPNRPACFGEEFHGRIPRQEVEELLRGSGGLVNGRYLVRESNSSPGNYSLSLSYDGCIEHYRLYYNSEKYSTSEDSGEKRFDFLTDLVIDILDMLRVVKHVDGQVPEKKERLNTRILNPHNFKPHTYKHPKWCDLCANFMWGLKAQGMKCEECGMNVHHLCMSKVRGECNSHVAVAEKEKPRKKTSTSWSPKDVSFSSNLFKVQCEYQEGCIQFVGGLNIPAAYFEPDALNPCYCDHCCQDVDTPLCKSGDPARYYSLPTGWCRFKLTPKAKETDVDKSTWNVAFLSISPTQIQEVLESKLGLQETDDGPQEGPKTLTKLTPSIICADLDATKMKYTNQETGASRAGQVVLQVYIEPFSYKVMGRAGSAEEIDPYFKKDSIYWVTNQTSSIVPFALLIKTMDATYLDL